MSLIRSLVMIALALWSMPAMATDDAPDLDRLLACQSATALADPDTTITTLAGDRGYRCHIHDRSGASTISCTGPGGQTRILGARVREFNLSRQRDGAAILSVALEAPPARIESTLASRAPDGSDPVDSVFVEEREDGIAELRCQIAGSGGGTGAIAGNLSFRGVEPVPSMRVCAAPENDTGNPVCVTTRSGARDYLIDQLPAGDYYVTAYPLENNPNRLFGIHTRPLHDCPAGQAGCASTQLQRVQVHAGETRHGVDPDTLVPQLPPSLRRNIP